MKKLSLFFALVLILPALFFAGCQTQEETSAYSIWLDYDAASHTAEANLQVDYVNNSENAFDEILFHLYPNAFSEEAEGSVCSPANENKTYPNGKSYGGITISSVLVSGQDSGFKLEGEDHSLLSVPLFEQLYPGERVLIDISFSLTLPNANHRFGYGENATNFANFYPIACVYRDGEGFVTDAYTSNGDPFFSDCSDYEVRVTYDSSFLIACSGDSVETTQNAEKKTSKISAKNVRDFAFVLSEKFSQISGYAGDVKVDYFYYDDEDATSSLATATKAIECYSEMFGSYPYSSFAVVQTNFVHGGMEYPQLVMISDTVKGVDYDYVIAHETAHQWWYGVVGNDEFNEAWLDESLTEYSTALFFEKHSEYGISYQQMTSGARSNYNLFLKTYKAIKGEIDTSMNRALDEFDTEPEYVNNIYVRGIIMFDTLRSQIGEKKFLNALSGYYSKFKFKNATTADFIATFEEKCGRQMEGFFYSWLLGEVVFIEMN